VTLAWTLLALPTILLSQLTNLLCSCVLRTRACAAAAQVAHAPGVCRHARVVTYLRSAPTALKLQLLALQVACVLVSSVIVCVCVLRGKMLFKRLHCSMQRMLTPVQRGHRACTVLCACGCCKQDCSCQNAHKICCCWGNRIGAHRMACQDTAGGTGRRDATTGSSSSTCQLPCSK
jgi:hypothetical protein